MTYIKKINDLKFKFNLESIILYLTMPEDSSHRWKVKCIENIFSSGTMWIKYRFHSRKLTEFLLVTSVFSVTWKTGHWLRERPG